MDNLLDKDENIIIFAILFLLLVLIYTIFRQRGLLKKKNRLLAEHEEKIKFLRQAQAENEYKQIQKENANEKIILELGYEIKKLEEKINDGAKNQVVAKIEAFKAQREQHQKRVDLG